MKLSTAQYKIDKLLAKGKFRVKENLKDEFCVRMSNSSKYCHLLNPDMVGFANSYKTDMAMAVFPPVA